MFSEFNVRAEISRIEALDVRPMRKARMLLAIARRAKKAAGRLVLLSRHHYRENDPLCGARFREAAQRLLNVVADVRQRAHFALGAVPEPLGYGYTSEGNAYPTWSRSDAQAVVDGSR